MFIPYVKKETIINLFFCPLLQIKHVIMMILGILAGETAAITLLPLHQGDFWEYKWDYKGTSWAQGGSYSENTDTGDFWVVLGTSKLISGVTAYQVQIFGKSHVKKENVNAGVTSFAPRWSYLAVYNNKLYGSDNGTTLVLLFNGSASTWTGGGFFTTVPSDASVTAGSGTIQNNYLNETATRVQRSADQSECETIGEITTCGDEAFNWSAIEYFWAIGPIGYKYSNTYYYSGGGFNSGGSRTVNIGLAASSFLGDTLNIQTETESNNAPAQAQLITLPVLVKGYASAGTGHPIDMSATPYPDAEPVVEDLYKFTLTSQTAVNIILCFDEYPNADLDLFLLQDLFSQRCYYFMGTPIAARRILC